MTKNAKKLTVFSRAGKTIRFKPRRCLRSGEVVVSSIHSRLSKIISGDSEEQPASSGVGRRLTATIISTKN